MTIFPLCAHRPSILFIRSFVRACVRSFVRVFVRACVRSCVRACVRACVRSFICSFVRSCVRACVRSFIQAASAVLAAWPATLLYCPCRLIDRWWIPYYTHFSEQCNIMSYLVPSVRTQKPFCAQWPVYNMVT